MGLTMFLLFHLISLTVCYLATRSTFHYLSKHQVTPKHRYLLFKHIRIRHIGLFYIGSILTLTLYSFTFGIYYSL